MIEPKTALELKEMIVDYVKYLEDLGIVQRLEGGGLRVVADRMEFGIATNEKGDKGLAIILSSDTTKLQMIFVLDDKTLLSQMSRGIDEILREDRGDVV